VLCLFCTSTHFNSYIKHPIVAQLLMLFLMAVLLIILGKLTSLCLRCCKPKGPSAKFFCTVGSFTPCSHPVVREDRGRPQPRFYQTTSSLCTLLVVPSHFIKVKETIRICKHSLLFAWATRIRLQVQEGRRQDRRTQILQ
jgi:hypothetical protein